MAQSSGKEIKLFPFANEPDMLQDCQFAVARKRQTLESSGHSGLTALSFLEKRGRNQEKNPILLACRPSGDEDTELLIISEDDIILSKTAGWPLARDNPVIQADPGQGGWIAYPSLTHARRQILADVLPGIPVACISTTLEIELSWIPWEEWRLNGPSRIHPAGKRLLVATNLGWTTKGERLSGIYANAGNGWDLRFPGQVDIESLASDPDGRTAAWREQVRTTEDTEQYGKLKYEHRIEIL